MLLHRHVIADLIRNPEVKGRAYNKTTQPTESPSPLMGEESKARVKQDNTTNPSPSFPRRRESTEWAQHPSYWL